MMIFFKCTFGLTCFVLGLLLVAEAETVSFFYFECEFQLWQIHTADNG